MKMFMLKIFCLSSLLFIGVLTGIEMTNNGIQKMKGINDNNTVIMRTAQKGATVPLSDISSHNIEAKKKKLEEMNAVNFFSLIGRKMSDGLTNASVKLIDRMTK